MKKKRDNKKKINQSDIKPPSGDLVNGPQRSALIVCANKAGLSDRLNYLFKILVSAPSTGG